MLWRQSYLRGNVVKVNLKSSLSLSDFQRYTITLTFFPPSSIYSFETHKGKKGVFFYELERKVGKTINKTL